MQAQINKYINENIQYVLKNLPIKVKSKFRAKKFLLVEKFRHDEKTESESFFETLRLKVSLQCSSPYYVENKTIKLCVLFKSCKIFFNTSIVNAKKFSRTGTHVRVIMLSLRPLAVDELKNRVINGLSF